MKAETKKAIIESAKEVLRIAFFGAVTAVLGYASTKVASLDPSSAYYIVGTILLRAIDKYIHENKNIGSNGISPV